MPSRPTAPSTALLGSFSFKYVSEGVPRERVDIFLRETSKSYVEISSALCILAGRYDSHCLRRVEILKEIYPNIFPDLYEIIPDLVRKIAASAAFKVDSVNNPINVNPVDYWFTTRNDLLNVTLYYFSKYLHISTIDLIEFTDLLEKRMLIEYYAPLINNYLLTKKLPRSNSLLQALNIAYNIKQNINYSILALKEHKFSFSLIKGIASPCIKAFSAFLLALFSINEDGTFNSVNLEEAIKKTNFVKLANCTPANRWEEAKMSCLKLLDLSQHT